MNKLLSFFIFTIVIFIFNGSSYARVLKIGTLEFPPFNYTENGKFVGSATEIVNEALKIMNIDYSYKVYPTKRGHDMLKNGEIDMWNCMARTKKRMEFLYYHEHALQMTYWGFYIHQKDKNRLKYEKFEDLKDKKIGYVRGYYAPPDIKKYMEENSKIRYVTIEEKNYNKLLNGRLDYLLGELTVGSYFEKKLNKENELHFLSNRLLITTGGYAAMSMKSKIVDKKFVTQFSRALEQVKASGKWDEIIKKYHVQTLDIDLTKATWTHLP